MHSQPMSRAKGTSLWRKNNLEEFILWKHLRRSSICIWIHLDLVSPSTFELTIASFPSQANATTHTFTLGLPKRKTKSHFRKCMPVSPAQPTKLPASCACAGDTVNLHTDTQAHASSLLGHCQFLAEITQMSLLNFHYCSPFLVQQYVLILNWTTINFTQFDRSFALACSRSPCLVACLTVSLCFSSPTADVILAALSFGFSLRVRLCLCDNFIFTISTLFDRFTHCTRYIRCTEYILCRWIDWNERALNMAHAIVTLYHWKWEAHRSALSCSFSSNQYGLQPSPHHSYHKREKQINANRCDDNF